MAIAAISALVIRKKVEMAMEAPATVADVLSAAGADMPTPTMAKAKAGRIWPKLLLAAQFKATFGQHTAQKRTILFQRQDADGQKRDHGQREQVFHDRPQARYEKPAR